MVSQHGILLAVNIISDHFGPIVSKVCGCLLRNGALSLQDIVRRLELSPGQVKNSLLILIQHNCVQAYTSPRGAGDRTVTLYLAIFDNVLHRLRFSKFLSVVRVDIPESEVLLEGLLQNGRLTFEQLVERTIFKVSEDSPLPTREEVRMNFNKLVYAHYVERCPKPEPFFDPLAVEQPTSTRKRAPKTVEAVLSLEQKVVCTAALSDAERFSEIPYFMDGSSSAKDGHHAVAGNKRKHETLEVDEDDSIIAESEVLWRINFERFIFCLKKKFCAERKKAKMRLGTLAIWEAFFEANVTNNDNKTGNTHYESLVKKKHGQEAYTIFRLLLKQGSPVETDEITDRTILDKQVVHETLYKLWKDEYIDSERVPSTSATGTGSAQFFVWRVKNIYREHFMDNLYHAALNLRQMVNYMAELLLEGSKDEIKLRNRKNILILALTRHDESLMLFHDF
ncbi:LOW QUALITY PROTEIN: DNA-directed RNA polymerase III subunit RPC3-like [Zea mays]|uniref:LOW QUALITY PROTEIN: DNA-directed RNA polymerase III subunit RPC3-like n=1 Tax=Zea mays TaxID=4577 RepID=UPI001652646C|nr:LOW QUALITY PROTEIN: DNA-directed RNA polymerase III subunit RPC3-like [Zea mays]